GMSLPIAGTTGRRASRHALPDSQAVKALSGRAHALRSETVALDKRVPTERIVFYMSAPGQQDEALEEGAQPAGGESASDDGMVEVDERRAELDRLRAAGIDPYPPVSLWATRTRIADVLAAHDAATLEAGEHPELRYQIAGRLISRRGHGKTAFLDIRDLSGSIQAVVRVDALGQEPYDRILALDIGDIVGILGCVYVTQRGQLALAVVECTLLTKALRPPPDKHHGLGDTGTRYRYRELDLM